MVHFFALLVAVLYPFVIYFGLDYFSPLALGGLLAACVLLRVLFGGMSHHLKGLALLVIVLLLVLHRWMHDDQQLLRFYPVAVNFVMLMVFSHSLLRERPLIETIALSRGLAVGHHNRRYLRVLTLVWSVFFVVNVLISAWTAVYATMSQWLLYNGFVSYLLIGLLVGAELIYRPFYQRHHSGNDTPVRPPA